MHRYKRLLVVVLFLLLLLALFEFSGLRAQINLQFVRQSFDQNKVGGLLIFVLLFSLGNLIQIPGTIFLAAAVLTLGQWWGGLATYVAACTSCAITFGLIRLLGRDALRQLDGRLAARIFARLDAHPVQSVVLLRILFQTVPVLNYTLAMSGVGFGSYLLGTLAGLPLPILLYTVFFDYLARLLHFPVV